MQRALVLAALTAAPIIAPPAPGSTTIPGKTIVVETRDGFELAGTYFAPRNGRSPAALLIHDAGADRSQLKTLGERLQKRGFGVLAIDLRGHGESRSAKFNWDTVAENQRSAHWQRSTGDVKAAADWILDQRDIHSTSLSILGVRAGCALAVKHAMEDANVVSMTLLSPHYKEYGFDIEGTIIEELDGLPTCVIELKNNEGEKMVADIHNQTSEPWINLISIPPNRKSVLDDRKAPAKIATWMGDVALPKKGGRKGKGR